MRRQLILAVVVLQVLVLVYMGGTREWILANGETVYLRTAPIDPRDPFRGDFVRLNYEINAIGSKRLDKEMLEKRGVKGHKVYTMLQVGEDGITTSTKTVDVEPDEGLFIKGRTTKDWRFGRRTDGLRIKYGIEQFFVEQGKGLAIEKQRGRRNTIQVPMEVQVALGSDGTAVIKDYRWSSLGMKLEVTRTPQRRRGTPIEEIEGPLSPKLKITLQNVSEKPLGLYLPDDHCSFKLIPTDWVNREYQAKYKGCENRKPQAQDFVTLVPEQEQDLEFDLADSRWHMALEDKVSEIGRLNVNDMFRLVYQSPTKAALSQIDASAQAWLGRMPSRAFNASGRVD